MPCERSIDVERYHDGELAPSDQASLEAHLSSCDECRRVLAALRGLSRLLARASRAEMPTEVARRLSRARPVAGEQSLRRLALSLTAAAAAVLIGSLLVLPPDHANGTASPGVWETLAVMPPAEGQDEGGDFDLVATSQWMADDLAHRERE